MWIGIERRQAENQPGRRESDQTYCPLHATHHDQIANLAANVNALTKETVSMKLFSIFVGSSITIMLAVGGIMIASQSNISEKISEIKAESASISTKLEMHMESTRRHNSPTTYYNQSSKLSDER